jgi:hypothetical protein
VGGLDVISIDAVVAVVAVELDVGDDVMVSTDGPDVIIAVAVLGGLDVISINAVVAVVGVLDVGDAVIVPMDGPDVIIIAVGVLVVVDWPEGTAIADTRPSPPAPFSCCLLRRNSKYVSSEHGVSAMQPMP